MGNAFTDPPVRPLPGVDSDSSDDHDLHVLPGERLDYAISEGSLDSEASVSTSNQTVPRIGEEMLRRTETAQMRLAIKKAKEDDSIGTLGEKRLANLIELTGWTGDFLSFLFKKYSHDWAKMDDEGNYVLNKRKLLKLIPQFKDCEKFLKCWISMFSEGLVPSSLATQTFEEFAYILSVVSNKDNEKRSQLVARLVRTGQKVRKKKVQQISSEIQTALRTQTDFRNPYPDSSKDVINGIFDSSQRNVTTVNDHDGVEKFLKLKQSEAQKIPKKQEILDRVEEKRQEVADRELDKEEFIRRIQGNQRFSDCFGLFPFLYLKFVLPLRKQFGGLSVSPADKDAKTGILVVEGKEMECTLHGRFFAVKEPGASKYTRVYSLGMSTLKCGEPDSLQFSLIDQLSKTMVFTAKTLKEKYNWCDNLYSLEDGIAVRFGSSCKVRRDCNAKWYCGGKQYWTDLLPALRGAKKRILITGWYISPGLLLIRGGPMDKSTRLDLVLQERAQAGVKIYILLYRNFEATFTLQSKHVKRHFRSLSPNFHVHDHPRKRTVNPWTHHQKTVIIDDKLAFVGGIDLAYGRYEDERYSLSDDNGEHFLGRDYQNLCFAGEANGPTTEEHVDRKKHPRMPWQDIHSRTDGLAAFDAARNFVERWNFTSDHQISHLSPKEVSEGMDLPIDKTAYPNCKLQLLRSVGEWSFGSNQTETSIYSAYLTAILDAKHYIYIENQFFVSSCSKGTLPANTLAKALFKRISYAIDHQQNFHVVVCLPAYTAGDLAQGSTKYCIKHVIHSVQKVLDKTKKKLHHVQATHPSRIKENVEDYISFYALRNHGILYDSKVVTEQIYIHSKLMIVDDNKVIIGSANINDRSFLGDHDSEIAYFIQQSNSALVDTVMNGVKYRGSPYAMDLRKHLWGRWLGVDADSKVLIDPVARSCRKLFLKTAEQNTKAYISLFGVIPNNMTKLSQAKKQNVVDVAKYKSCAASQDYWKGHLTWFPLQFLEKENLGRSLFSREILLSKAVFI